VHSLREPDDAVVLVERLRREASIGRTALGFAPSLVVRLDDEVVDAEPAHEELVDELESRVGADMADDIVAVVREGLSNAARHAHATSVQVRVTVSGRGPRGRVRVEVEDDGVGTDLEMARRSGLANLSARARRHGGTCDLVDDARTRGTLLVWEVPLV